MADTDQQQNNEQGTSPTTTPPPPATPPPPTGPLSHEQRMKRMIKVIDLFKQIEDPRDREWVLSEIQKP